MFNIASLFGYFLVMLIFMIIAIIVAKSKASWVLVAIGAGIQLFSLIGLQKQKEYVYMDTTPYWWTYAIILLVTAAVIVIRSSDQNN